MPHHLRQNRFNPINKIFHCVCFCDNPQLFIARNKHFYVVVIFNLEYIAVVIVTDVNANTALRLNIGMNARQWRRFCD